MKRRITLSIALAVSLTILLLTGSDSRVEAQNQIKPFADTGMMKLGPNQILRITAAGNFGPQTEAAIVRFRQMNYMQTDCSDAVCKHAVQSQSLSEPIALAPGEAASFTCLPGALPVRAIVLTNNRNVRVNATIIDAVTGEVTSFITDWIIDPIA